MLPAPSTIIYRIGLADGACRSALALLTLRAEALEGVRAASVTADNQLVLVAEEGADLFEDLIKTIVRAGLDPLATSVTAFERESA